MIAVSNLSKRTQILFTKEEFEFLKEKSKEEKISIGELIRRAVRKSYGAVGRKAKIKAAKDLFKLEIPVSDWEEEEKKIIRGRFS